jgi:hypothetical protein
MGSKGQTTWLIEGRVKARRQTASARPQATI